MVDFTHQTLFVRLQILSTLYDEIERERFLIHRSKSDNPIYCVRGECPDEALGRIESGIVSVERPERWSPTVLLRRIQ